jgi:AcrR family transcriptional regulator
VAAAGKSQPPTMRERYRAQVRHEVKQAALAQLEQAGPAAVSISAIGKQLGVSGPALYRYFASRDELLTELAIDAYRDLANALTPSRHASQSPRVQVEAAARAYRSWALAQPHRYRLLFGPPLPGYDAHAQPLVDAAQAGMNVLLGIFGEVRDDAAPPPQPLAAQLAAWAHDSAAAALATSATAADPAADSAARPPADSAADPATALRAILAWSRLHGIVSLEIAGNFASMGIDPSLLFELQLATLTT